MPIIGHGIDIEDLVRFPFLVDDDWIARVFTPAEIGLIPKGARRMKYIASRFSAKEAAMKAFGLSLGSNASFKDFEIFREVGCAPKIKLSVRMEEKADELGASSIILSLSHSESSVVASVIISSG